MAELLGKKLLNYRIEKLLGQGGMGEVYLGVHTEIERRVAIKVISPALAQDERIRERFKREALILSKLNHPNIVQLYDFWDRPEGLFLIMEYVNGISLDRYIHRVVRGPLPLKFATDLFLQILDAFQYAHDQGVIHRDIKPSNILIRNDNVVKILDFGIARILAGDATQSEKQKELTRTGTTLGTVAYMSPEQIKAKSPNEIDHRSDIYSLGLVFFEMLTGRPAYDRNALSEFDLLLKIATEPPPKLLSVNPNLPPQLETIIEKALAKDPKDRYPTCSEFAAEIMRLMSQYEPKFSESTSVTFSAPNPALTYPTITRKSPLSELPNTPQQEQDASESKKTRPIKKFLLIGIGILALISVLLILISRYIQYRQQEEARRIAQDFVEKALRQHNASLLSSLLADTLQQFFDKPQKTLQDIQRGYTQFWESIQSDSVSWIGEVSISKAPDAWRLKGDLYYRYTTKPRKEVETKKRYNRLWGKYDTYYDTKIIPAQTICKIKTIELLVRSSKIVSITQLQERGCE